MAPRFRNFTDGVLPDCGDTSTNFSSIYHRKRLSSIFQTQVKPSQELRKQVVAMVIWAHAMGEEYDASRFGRTGGDDLAKRPVKICVYLSQQVAGRLRSLL